jgi:16S rRNA (cytosine1402-N4)-methyltransferase
MAASSPNGWLFGFDRDGAALEAAEAVLAPFAGRFELHRAVFAEVERWVAADSCDGVVLDLGVSSPQLDQASRGFSFQQDGPLDMRMDPTQGLTAAEVVNGWPAEDLARVFAEWGEEPRARRLARAIEEARRLRPLRTTLDLAGLIERCVPRAGARVHPATRVFQALRLVVNDEVGGLERGLAACWRVLKQGGRMAVITFHSIEARMVKDFGRRLARDYDVPGEVDVPELRRPRNPELRIVTRKARGPSDAEVEANPRSRSAQLRVYEKI